MATYIIRAGEHGPVKIGRADDVPSRLADLQTGHHETLHVIRILDTPFDAEPILHARFAALRLRGEWFDFSPEMLSFVPEAPDDDLTVGDAMKRARNAAQEEASSLVLILRDRYRHVMDRKRFLRHLAALLQCTPRRVRALRDREARRIDVHELEGLRVLARKTAPEAPSKIGKPLPLFDRLEGGR